ncbi:MAG: M3 family metallopeptidase [Bacteroidales bacterium]|nr:M3 family metallopeptidase [Bacteroidales bacterium]
MKRMSLVLLSSLLLVSSCHNKKNPLSDNPFLQEWNTPYGVPPFDKIKAEHYMPAFTEGMKQHDEAIAAIIDNKETPTFANTIEALEYSHPLLDKVSGVFFNLSEAIQDTNMEKISEEIAPILSEHNDNISLNKALFAKIKVVYDTREAAGLTGEQLRLLEETYKDFMRGGAGLNEAQHARFKEINQHLSLLSLKYGNNVLKATNSYQLVVDDVAKLDGMPESQLAAALETGNSNENTKGKYVFTIHLPSMEPFLMNCKNRELRKELWTAYASRCSSGETDNRANIDTMVNLRLEKAKMLGYASYADYILDETMAKTPEAVNDLLMQVWTPALAKATEEAKEYQQMINKEGGKFKLEPYDWRYYAEKMRREKYDLDDEIIRPYFPLDNVREGAFMVAEKLYGVTFKENKQLPVYQKDVIAFEVREGDAVRAILYMDFFPRESKRSGAWMTNFREQYIDQNGKNVIPVVSLVFNFTKPTGNTPSLLNFDETSTLFHEFGHAMHSILSQCHYQSLSGTNVPRDFVEMPSQIMENWAGEPEVMRMYAKHYKTGEIIPDSLIAKLQAAANYGQGFMNTELLAASLLDMQYHTITQPTAIVLPTFEDQSMQNIGLIPQIISRYKSPYFQHIFSGGYGCGYYSYTWSAMLDSDAFESFKENGLFDPATAKAFRVVISNGNTQDLNKLYETFKGRKPTIDALLKKRGLKN